MQRIIKQIRMYENEDLQLSCWSSKSTKSEPVNILGLTRALKGKNARISLVNQREKHTQLNLLNYQNFSFIKTKVSRKTSPHINTDMFLPYDN